MHRGPCHVQMLCFSVWLVLIGAGREPRVQRRGSPREILVSSLGPLDTLGRTIGTRCSTTPTATQSCIMLSLFWGHVNGRTIAGAFNFIPGMAHPRTYQAEKKPLQQSAHETFLSCLHCIEDRVAQIGACVAQGLDGTPELITLNPQRRRLWWATFNIPIYTTTRYTLFWGHFAAIWWHL